MLTNSSIPSAPSSRPKPERLIPPNGISGLDRWYLGVQWHPEDDDGSEADRLRLFRAFVAAAEESRRGSVAQLAT